VARIEAVFRGNGKTGLERRVVQVLQVETQLVLAHLAVAPGESRQQADDGLHVEKARLDARESRAGHRLQL